MLALCFAFRSFVMNPVQNTRLLLALGCVLLTACAAKPTSVTLQESQQSDCPLELNNGQTLMISLPSNPTTGFRWIVTKPAAGVLKSMGPEVYTNPEDAGMVGSGGKSTWRFKAYQAGQDALLIQYQRPWEQGVAPAKTFACEIQVD
jgi:inhibitor of cysteine peptidase